MIDKILGGFSKVGSLISKGFNNFFDFLAKPLGYLLEFLESIFYFFAMLFTVVVKIVKIFTALMQFFWALATSVLKTVGMWIGVVPSGSMHLPGEAQ
ncbi:hypothetical protein P9149_14635, partial [Bacillus thuringiensis]|nr:hypothetical protein [Bacillus thuringiensis]